MTERLTPDSMEFSFLIHLLDLMEARDWARLERVARSNRRTFKFLSESIADCEDFNGMTLLHAIARHDPPPKLLRWMIKMHPRALMGEDCMGRTPLHVATGTSASLDVIELLTCAYPLACDVKDADGRIPLHYACDSHCELFEDDERTPRPPPDVEVIRVLLTASFESAIVEDETETNAVEYAILSNAPIEAVTLLQRASLMVLRNEAPTWNSDALLELELETSVDHEEVEPSQSAPFHARRRMGVVAPSGDHPPATEAARPQGGGAKDGVAPPGGPKLKRKSTASTTASTICCSEESSGEELTAKQSRGKRGLRGFAWY